MKISVTLLSAYLYCSRKLFLEEVLMLEEPPKESLVLGSLRHNVFDHVNKIDEDIVTSITKKVHFEEINEIYFTSYKKILRKMIVSRRKELDEVNVNMLDAYRRVLPSIEEEASARSFNLSEFIRNNNIFGDELWHRLTPKILSELRVESEELRLKGIIDQVHVYENDYVPFELKTGRTPREGVWPGHRIQVAAYSLLLQEKFNKPVKEGFVYYLDSKEKRHIGINPFMKEEIKKIVDEVIALLESDKLPGFVENRNKCMKCGLKDTCYNDEHVNSLLKVKVSHS